MNETVEIRAGTFKVILLMDGLLTLPIRNVRKLVRLVNSAPWENRETIEKLGLLLPEKIKSSKKLWETASQDYANGWRLVRNKKRRDQETVEILHENHRLTQAVKDTKAAYDRWLKINSIYKEN